MSERHLDIEALIDIAERTRPTPLHAENCDVCREQLAGLRSAMAAVMDVEVPEPSPLFWDHLSLRVREAVGAEPAPRPGFWDAWSWRPVVAVSALAVSVLAAAFGVSRDRASRSIDGESVPTATVEGARPAGPGPGGIVEIVGIDDAPLLQLADGSDPSLDLIADLSEGLDWEAATAAGWTTATGALDGAFDRLNEAERAALHRFLQEALSGKGA